MLSPNLQFYDETFKNPFLILFFTIFIKNFRLQYSFSRKISQLPDINLSVLQHFKYINWDFYYLSRHKNFELDWVKQFPDKGWDFKYLTRLKNFELDWVKQFPDKGWDFTYLTRLENFELDWVKQFPDKGWDFYYLSRHKNFELEWVKQFPDKGWDYYYITRLENFELEWVKQFPDKGWNYYYITRLENFELDWVKQFPDKGWDFKYLTRLKNFELDWVKQFPDKGWDFKYLTRLENFELEWVKQFPDKGWDFKYLNYFYYLSRHKNFELDWVKQFPDANWDYKYLNIRCNYLNIESSDVLDTIYNRLIAIISLNLSRYSVLTNTINNILLSIVLGYYHNVKLGSNKLEKKGSPYSIQKLFYSRNYFKEHYIVLIESKFTIDIPIKRVKYWDFNCGGEENYNNSLIKNEHKQEQEQTYLPIKKSKKEYPMHKFKSPKNFRKRQNYKY